MLNRSRSRYNGRNLPATFLQEMAFYGATDAWDFVNQSYLRAGRVAPSGITFTRASVGYAETSDGRLVEFASGVPRITDRGLLIEGARTNAYLQSQAIGESAWTKSSGTTIATNAAIAPDGTQTADRVIVGSSAGTIYRIQQNLTYTSGQTTVHTWFVKKSSYRYAFAYGASVLTADLIVFDMDTGTFTTNQNTRGALVATLANGWYRISYTIAATGDGTTALRIGFGTQPDDVSVNGDGTSGGLIWGLQAEQNVAFPTTYIKTEGSTVTRAADVADVSSLTISDAHSLLAFKGASSAAANETLIQLDDGTTDNRSLLYRNTTGRILTDSGAGNQADQAIGTWATTAQRYAARIATDDVRGALNGTLGTADTTATLPAGILATFRMGQNAAGNALNGYLQRTVIFPLALTDLQLEGITA